MGYEPTVFNQLFNFIPRYTFQKAADRLGSDRYAKSFRAWPQFLVLLYAQATGKQTLKRTHRGIAGACIPALPSRAEADTAQHHCGWSEPAQQQSV